MSNPYQSPSGQPEYQQPSPYQQKPQHIAANVECRKVRIRPIQLLKDAYELVGEQYWLFVGVVFVGMLVGGAAPFGILMGPMLCGIHLCFIQRRHGKQVQFGLLFKGFDHFVESLLAMLIMVGVSFVFLLPLFIVFLVVFFAVGAGSGEPGPEFLALILGFEFVGFIVMMLVGLPFAFVFHLIAGRHLKVMSAIKGSFKGVMSNLFGLLGMMFVYGILGMFAFCMCYFPVFLLMPLSFGATYLAYEQIFESVDSKMHEYTA